MTLDSSKILSISFKEYADSQGKELRDYNVLGVHVNLEPTGPGTVVRFSESINREFKKVVLESVEAIVDYHVVPSSSLNEFYAYGTALIPKNIETKKEAGI